MQCSFLSIYCNTCEKIEMKKILSAKLVLQWDVLIYWDMECLLGILPN